MQVGEAKALHTTKRSSGIDVSDPSLGEAWASIRTDGEPQTNWCAFTYAEGSNSVINLLGSGTGGVPELCSILLDSMVAFCGVRVGDDKGSARFHRILFVGEEDIAGEHHELGVVADVAAAAVNFSLPGGKLAILPSRGPAQRCEFGVTSSHLKFFNVWVEVEVHVHGLSAARQFCIKFRCLICLHFRVHLLVTCVPALLPSWKTVRFEEDDGGGPSHEAPQLANT